MSKPILIVVVVVVVNIDVVFVKNMLGPKEILLKKNPCPKKLEAKKFWSKRVRSRKVVVQKKLSKKLRFKNILGPKNFGYKTLVRRSGSENLSKKKLEPSFKVWLKLTQ